MRRGAQPQTQSRKEERREKKGNKKVSEKRRAVFFCSKENQAEERWGRNEGVSWGRVGWREEIWGGDVDRHAGTQAQRQPGHFHRANRPRQGVTGPWFRRPRPALVPSHDARSAHVTSFNAIRLHQLLTNPSGPAAKSTQWRNNPPSSALSCCWTSSRAPSI